MDRRSVLALLASAPIAALVPWTHTIKRSPLAFHPRALELAMEPLAILSTAKADDMLIVSGGTGYLFGTPRWAVWNPDFEVRVAK